MNEHERRFNASMGPEVAAVIVGTEITKRDIIIIITKRDKTKQCDAKKHTDLMTPFNIEFCFHE